MKGGDEIELLSRARRMGRWRPGHARLIKRKFWKRIRKIARMAAVRDAA